VEGERDEIDCPGSCELAADRRAAAFVSGDLLPWRDYIGAGKGLNWQIVEGATAAGTRRVGAGLKSQQALPSVGTGMSSDYPPLGVETANRVLLFGRETHQIAIHGVFQQGSQKDLPKDSSGIGRA
jgi:hypothetical protein